MTIEKCIVIGAGNAGRPVARLLNFKGVDVTITDSLDYNQFTSRRKKMLDILKEEGVTLNLGVSQPDITDYDAVFLAPTISEESDLYQNVIKSSKTLITSKIISEIINDILDMDKIGITGSFGKTTTTTMLTNIFKAAGYNVYHCSSMKWNLLSEAIVDDIVNGVHIGADIAILELPHGTLGLFNELDLKIGVLTNLHPEHLCEFDGSMEKYVDRKSVILDVSQTLVANVQCGDLLTHKRDDTIYFNFKNNNPDLDDKYVPSFVGSYENDKYEIQIMETGETSEITIKTIAFYNYENLTAAISASMTYGISLEDIQKGIDMFEGVGGRMEYLGKFNGIEAYYDTSFGDQIRPALEELKDENLVVVMDNVDTTTVRDKAETGRVIGEYAKVLIATGYVEITETLDMDAALELLNAVEQPGVLKMAVCMVDEAAELAIKYAQPGDIIIHLGPGAFTSYEQVKNRMLTGLEEGVKRYGNN